MFKKVHRVIQFSQKAWLKRYIGINTILRTNELCCFWNNDRKFKKVQRY